MKLVDIAINLTDKMFKGVYRGKNCHADDFLTILQRAKEQDVVQLIITGTTLKESKQALEMAKEHDFYSTVGCHPTHSDECEKNPKKYLDDLTKLIESDTSGRIVAIGECGLDYDRLHFSSKEDQLKAFVRHFELTDKFQLPMFLHCRNSDEDFLRIVRENRHRFSTGVVHSFTGPIELMQQLVDLDLYIGINGCSMKTKENLAVVKEIPLDRLMLETDAPWCDIRPTHASYTYLEGYINPYVSCKKEKFVEGKMVKSRNEPCTMKQVLLCVAGIKQVPPEELADQVYQNTIKVFPQLA